MLAEIQEFAWKSLEGRQTITQLTHNMDCVTTRAIHTLQKGLPTFRLLHPVYKLVTVFADSQITSALKSFSASL